MFGYIVHLVMGSNVWFAIETHKKMFDLIDVSICFYLENGVEKELLIQLLNLWCALEEKCACKSLTLNLVYIMHKMFINLLDKFDQMFSIRKWMARFFSINCWHCKYLDYLIGFSSRLGKIWDCLNQKFTTFKFWMSSRNIETSQNVYILKLSVKWGKDGTRTPVWS
jgi:hypothetical protein